ncbi:MULTISPECIES: GDSL-type esterase/lipase family protein [Niastella]|uniref:SGNH hydrolase-type esterase domain-containing protein n=1 Tax=Niastella soli TaxID=2821487 RepID=A0ABS3YVE3_9BACT|nr:GDSL-type esterase/lipase family protein [Niastella soli]MBO9201914.1 hypothetical protein [Niastella soli]
MKKMLFISVIINLVLVLFIFGKRRHHSKGTLEYANHLNDEKNTLLQHLSIHKGDVVFIGNSITERFPLNEMFGSIRLKNRGIANNQTRHVLDRIGAVARSQPEQIFIEIGLNDLAQKIPQNQILTNLKAIIDTIKYNSPVTLIYIESILPTNGPNKYLMPAIVHLNGALKSFCRHNRTVFIDMFKAFEVEHHMNNTLTTDGTHLNYDGYLQYKHILEKYLDSDILALKS